MQKEKKRNEDKKANALNMDAGQLHLIITIIVRSIDASLPIVKTKKIHIATTAHIIVAVGVVAQTLLQIKTASTVKLILVTKMAVILKLVTTANIALNTNSHNLTKKQFSIQENQYSRKNAYY